MLEFQGCEILKHCTATLVNFNQLTFNFNGTNLKLSDVLGK